MPWISRPAASPKAAAPVPSSNSSVVPRMMCTSEMPTGKCGRISKNTSTAADAIIARAAKLARPRPLTSSAISLSATPADAAAVP